MAIALVLALSGSLFTFLLQIAESRTIAQAHLAIDRATNTLIDRIEVDLATCIVGGGGNGAGVKGDNTSLRVLTRSVPASLAERGRHDPDVLGDLQLSEYRFFEGAGRLEAKRTTLGRSPDRSAAFHPLGGDIHRVRFRYHDGTGWRERFDSLAQDRLPVAIEIAIWYRPWQEQEDDQLASSDDDEVFLGFDEDAIDSFDEPNDPYEEEPERLFEDRTEPPPDRVRVIVILDSDPESAGDDSPPAGEDEP